MKTREFYRPSAILSGVAVLCISLIGTSPVSAQDKKEQKTTTIVTATPSKGKKEQKVTVYASSDPKAKEGKIKVRIIKEENGKRTELDTLINAPGGIQGADLEKLMKDMHVQIKSAESDMKEAGDHMKNIQIYINGMDDSIAGDSAGKCRHAYTFSMPGCCPRFHDRDFFHAFNYNFEMPDVPQPPDMEEALENEFYSNDALGPQVFAVPDKGESLSDVLGNIPMSRVKSYKIIDKKGGKRIIIDVQDAQDFGRNNVIYIKSRHPHSPPPRGNGHNEEMKVIIHSGDNEGAAEKPESATPPAEPKK
jgi:hypothetical protein